MSENDALDFVKKWLSKLNYKNYTINVEDTGNKGDNYIGLIYFISVIAENKFNKKEKLDIVVKVAFTDEKIREFAPVKETYGREVYFYLEVLPVLQNFQKDLNLKNPFVSVPKCLSTSMEERREFLIFENLKKQGFDLWNRKVPMNDQHITFVLKELGKFHGISFALRTKDYNTFKRISDKLDNVMKSFLDNFENAMEFGIQKSLDILTEKGEVEARRKVEAVKDVTKIMTDYSECKDENYAVITHGDSWCNNMMFKYDNPNNTKPVEMRFLDFQLSRMAHPVLDLSYFFYTVANKQALDNFDEYLKIYHDSLSSYLEEAGCDPQELFPINKLKEHWRYYSRFGMFMSFMLIRMMYMDTDEAPELREEDMLNSFRSVLREEEKYRTRVTDVVLHCVQRGII